MSLYYTYLLNMYKYDFNFDIAIKSLSSIVTFSWISTILLSLTMRQSLDCLLFFSSSIPEI